ncbi:16S rRNA (cytosine(1402)-N(4))-methyltransferase RsmH [Patescibacteria group bacterium]|nr:16S rRNA (cytosine(1402)-N(4))-methyltransferase RsmH [Patescibacteria group bacterium]MBU1727825.1 16S rRNA (cytosine(1402)-N(4))-methyltransferase RsmH [Patescibacteria group bacterium]
MESVHRTVLLNETINGLNLSRRSVVLDCTFGGGGHSVEICRKYPGSEIIAIDQDQNAWEKARDKFKDIDCKISFWNQNFRNLDKVLMSEGIEKVDGVILDLGLSSDQLENSGRGFSFMKDEPLLMTMKENPLPEDLTARDIINTWSEKSLADVIYGYGEERFARKIAKEIVRSRKKQKVMTSFDLVRIIERSVPAGYRRGRLHFATKTFQAMRIAVNDELRTLQSGLEKGFEVLKKNGRMSVISFHSLEDRIAKKFFREKDKEGSAKLINKKVITASREEFKNNPRARSAKLRILEKII